MVEPSHAGFTTQGRPTVSRMRRSISPRGALPLSVKDTKAGVRMPSCSKIFLASALFMASALASTPEPV